MKRFKIITDDNGDQVLYQNVVLGGTTTAGGSSAGLVVVAGSAGGQGFNREDATGTTTPEKFTWPSGSRPSAITITAYNPGAVDVYLWVCFDAPDAATAAAWLAGAAGEAVDSQRYMVLPIDTASVLGAINVSGAPKDFEFTAPLSNMYYVTSTSTCAIHVEAS